MKIIAIGDYEKEKAPYHPFVGVDELLMSMLEPEHEVTYTGDYDVLKYENLKDYDLLISYSDAHFYEFEKAQGAGIIQFVAAGGRVLYLHGALCMAQMPELGQMMGAKFVEHPKQAVVEYTATSEHEIIEGVPVFSLMEEPYIVDFCYSIPCEHFLQYEYEGEFFPAGWTTTYGLGNVVYLQPGHTVEIFKDENVQLLIKNAVKYLTAR